MNNQTEYSDNEIVAKICQGETGLFEILVRRYNSYLYKIGRNYNYSHEDTEDLMQECYLSVFASLSGFESRSTFKTWIIQIMLNKCFQKKEKLSFQNEINMPSNDTEPFSPLFHQSNHTEGKVLSKELGHIIEQSLLTMPENHRLVFTLRELNGLNVAETSEVLKLSESNVKTQLNRAKVFMRAAIEKMYSPTDIFEFNLVHCDKMVHRVMSKIGHES